MICGSSGKILSFFLETIAVKLLHKQVNTLQDSRHKDKCYIYTLCVPTCTCACVCVQYTNEVQYLLHCDCGSLFISLIYL